MVHTVCACAGFSQHSRNSVSRSDISALLDVTLVYSLIIFRFRDGMSDVSVNTPTNFHDVRIHKIHACANSVYQAFPLAPGNEALTSLYPGNG